MGFNRPQYLNLSPRVNYQNQPNENFTKILIRNTVHYSSRARLQKDFESENR